jgi:hypothetical protein
MSVGWVVVVVIVAVVGVAGWWLWSRSRRRGAVPEPTPARVSRVTDPTPMTGLEVALDQVTDRSGRRMRDKIEGSTEIDALIVPDDTGPILRRALDNVEQAEHASPPAAPDSAAEAATDDKACGESPANEG